MVSSGATIPARAPPSIDMLQTVMRPSMDSDRIASPVYSNTYPVPPPIPILEMSASIRSLATMPSAGIPSNLTSQVFDRFWSRHCVASTCSTSVVPMPKARAPNAPCVDVWLSPQTTVIPGRVRPSSGPITWTMPCDASPTSAKGTPNSWQFVRSCCTCLAAMGSTMGSAWLRVGML